MISSDEGFRQLIELVDHVTDRPLVRDTPGAWHEFRVSRYGSIAFLACH